MRTPFCPPWCGDRRAPPAQGQGRLARRLVALAGAASAACATLPPFTADLHRRQVGSRTVRAPYATVASYFGYIAPATPPEDIDGAEKGFLLYAWLPEAVDEVGVRAVSPVAGRAAPRAGVDTVDPAFPARADSQVAFDPAVRLERCLSAINPEDIAKPCPQWVALGANDDSDELPADRTGARRNALVRVAASRVDPLRALVRGLYRVVLSQAKVGDLQGTFVVQVGVPNLVEGLVVARDPAALAARVDPAKRACGPADGRLPSGGQAAPPPASAAQRSPKSPWTPPSLHKITCSPSTSAHAAAWRSSTPAAASSGTTAAPSATRTPSVAPCASSSGALLVG